MDETLDLIERIGSEDAPTDAELVSARAELADLLKETLAGETPDLAAGREIRKAIDALDAELKVRAEQEAADKAEAEKLLEGVQVDADEEPAETEAETEAVDDSAAVAASAEQPGHGIDPSRFTDAVRNARARVQADAELPSPSWDVSIHAVGAAQGFTLGDDATMNDVARLFNSTVVSGTPHREILVRVEKQYPEERQVGIDVVSNTRLLDAVMGPQAIAAAGGICGPLQADFTHPICGDRGRPIRDALPAFNATRGGLRYAPAASVGDLTAAITDWDIATDESPGATVKNCLVVECVDEVEVKVDAIVACLQIGNFQARFNPEFWRSRLELVMVEHDRVAEVNLNTQIVALSTAVTYAGADGTIYSVLSAIDKATAGIRSRHRLDRGTRFRAILPQWVYDALRSDIAKQRLSGSVGNLQLADQVLANFFSTRNVTPTISPDLDLFGAQAAGALLDYPGANTVVTVFPEGTFLFLDGGTYDLGTEITDSTLNATNDRQAFVETFEKVAKRGCESLSITVPIAEACQCAEELVVGSV